MLVQRTDAFLVSGTTHLPRNGENVAELVRCLLNTTPSDQEVIREREISGVDVGERGQRDRRVTARPVHVKAY